MAEANDPLSMLRAAAAAREAAGLRRVLQPRDCGLTQLIDFASNDYLGLARHPQVIDAAVEAAHTWGTGATGSRLVTGSTTIHATLERALAGFLGAEAALVFSSGYLANLSVITALTAVLSAPPATHTPPPATHTPPPATPLPEPAAPLTPAPPATTRPPQPPPSPLPGADAPRPSAAPSPPRPAAASPAPATLVVSDALNHASLVDACRLARARVEIVGHQDVAAIERALAHRREPNALVVTESAFSVGGRLAPLKAMHNISRDHQAVLVIDEAHALGVVGPGGRGAAWQAGIAGEPDVIRTISLSKALGAQGGAVLGANAVIDTLVSTGRGFIFDTALAPPSAAAALQALRILEHNPELPRRAQNAARHLAATAAELGLQVSPPGAAVVKVVLGEPGLALTAQRICADHGLRAGCFRPPSVPPGGSCLRLTARASLTEQDILAATGALAAVRDHARATSPVGRKTP